MATRRRPEDEEYYHGFLPREDMKELLKEPGQFLVRKSETVPGQPRQTVLSVCIAVVNGKPQLKHVVVLITKDGKFSFDMKRTWDSFGELIMHHITTGQPVLAQVKESKITTPVLRQTWELLHDNVKMEKKLGQGAFGEVWAAKMKFRDREIPVAVKQAKEGLLSKEKMKEVMREARLMRNFDHPNVVKLYGVAVEKEPLLIVMELINGGSLDTFLRKNTVPLAEKNKMVMDAAWGIEYLHSRNCLHRDIAARNCLYTEEKLVKISDFGLSKETKDGMANAKKENNRVAIRWVAPEIFVSLIYSKKSDVWAFGVLAWEIYSNASEPYTGSTNAEVKIMVLTGQRLKFSSEADETIGNIVLSSCWDNDPEKRLPMDQISMKLEDYLGVKPPHIREGPVNSTVPSKSPSVTASTRTRTIKQVRSVRQVRSSVRSMRKKK